MRVSNFMDNCWDYHDGGSEIRMGKALQGGYRKKVFLMTKIDGRDRKTAAQQIDDSLKRLQTDVIDLLQFHEIIRLEDPDRIFAEGGAMEAVQAAKKAGKIRYIGFTGHKDPIVHLRMLEIAEKHQFRFDAVQMPINVMDAHFRSFVNKVVPVLVREKIGVLGMKSMGGDVILQSKTVSPVECLHYAMSQPTATVITGIDSMEILQQNLNAVKTFKPLTAQEMATLLAKTAKAASAGKVREVQDDQRLRRHRQEPRMARLAGCQRDMISPSKLSDRDPLWPSDLTKSNAKTLHDLGKPNNGPMPVFGFHFLRINFKHYLIGSQSNSLYEVAAMICDSSMNGVN